MPAPGRGIAVLHVGKVTAVADAYVTVDLAGQEYDCPSVTSAPAVGDTVWVASVGRTMLVLGVTVGTGEPDGCWSAYEQTANAATFTLPGPLTVGVYGTLGFEAGDIAWDGTPTDPEMRVTAATNVDADNLDPLPGSWGTVGTPPFAHYGWGWSQGSVADVVVELRWTGTAQITSFCAIAVDNT